MALQTLDCSVWQVHLRAGTPTARRSLASGKRRRDDAFDHFPELSLGELEILAGDAKRQLLEEGSGLAWTAADAQQLSEAQQYSPATQQRVQLLNCSEARGALGSTQGGEWINVDSRDAPPARQLLNAASVRYNLTLDKEVFPLLAHQRSATPALLSPAEPKRQVIGDAQRQQVARSNSWSIAGAFVVVRGASTASSACMGVRTHSSRSLME